MFLRNDPNRTGRVMDEKLAGLIKGLRSEGLTRKTERAIEQGGCFFRVGCLCDVNQVGGRCGIQLFTSF